MIIRILSIDHRHGTNTSAFGTYEEARQSLHDYVAGEWEAEIGDLGMPDDEDEAIEEYFDAVESESYKIEEDEIKQKVWVLYGSHDWNEFSEVHLTKEAAHASMRMLFEIPDTVSDEDLGDAVTEAYEAGDWKAFAINEHEL